jgi:hypothetical protein
LKKLFAFCNDHNYEFPSANDNVLAEFLCHIADSSERPKSQLNTTLATIGCLMDSLGWANPVKHGYLSKMVDGLTKTATLKPMLKTKVLPIQPFVTLFSDSRWTTSSVTVKDLRMRAICLLALVLMARPSDFDPQARTYDPNTGLLEQVVLSEDQVIFNQNGDLTITLHGIKNDYSRDGFTITIPGCEQSAIDPVRCLKEYIDRTSSERIYVKHKPVFLTLTKPYKQLSAKGISGVLHDAIKAAGLANSGYSAKSFRPSGATHAISMGLHPDTVRHIGRWRSQEVFEKHYVNYRVPQNYTNDLLST